MIPFFSTGSYMGIARRLEGADLAHAGWLTCCRDNLPVLLSFLDLETSFGRWPSRIGILSLGRRSSQFLLIRGMSDCRFPKECS